MRDFQPLDLGRCRLMPFTSGHLTQSYVDWLNDPETVRYSEQRHRTHSPASSEAYFRTVSASGNLFLAIEAVDLADAHVGNITVAFDQPNLSADVSILIGAPAARGTGIATLAWCGILSWLLTDGGMRRITAGTMATNLPMIALMKKSGMTIECTRPRAFLCEGAEVDLVLAARFAMPADG